MSSFQKFKCPTPASTKGEGTTISYTPACNSFPSIKTSLSLTPVLRRTRVGGQLRTQLRVGLLEYLVLSLQICEVLLEVFDLLVLALPERSLRLPILGSASLLSLLVAELAFCLRGWGGFQGYVQLPARSSCRLGL